MLFFPTPPFLFLLDVLCRVVSCHAVDSTPSHPHTHPAFTSTQPLSVRTLAANTYKPKKPSQTHANPPATLLSLVYPRHRPHHHHHHYPIPIPLHSHPSHLAKSPAEKKIVHPPSAQLWTLVRTSPADSFASFPTGFFSTPVATSVPTQLGSYRRKNGQPIASRPQIHRHHRPPRKNTAKPPNPTTHRTNAPTPPPPPTPQTHSFRPPQRNTAQTTPKQPPSRTDQTDPSESIPHVKKQHPSHQHTRKNSKKPVFHTPLTHLSPPHFLSYLPFIPRHHPTQHKKPRPSTPNTHHSPRLGPSNPSLTPHNDHFPSPKTWSSHIFSQIPRIRPDSHIRITKSSPYIYSIPPYLHYCSQHIEKTTRTHPITTKRLTTAHNRSPTGHALRSRFGKSSKRWHRAHRRTAWLAWRAMERARV